MHPQPDRYRSDPHTLSSLIWTVCKMLPIYTQGKIRTVRQSSEDLRLENPRNVAHTTSDASEQTEPKVRQVGQAETVAEANKPLRIRSLPAGPREPPQALRRTATRREERAEQVGEVKTEVVAEESKSQRTRSRLAGPREPPASRLVRSATRHKAKAETQTQENQRQEVDRFQRTIPHPSGPREPAPLPQIDSRQSYGAVTDILNTYHFRDSFYERYIPWNIGTNNTNNRSQSRESEVPFVSRFDWTSNESDDGRGQVFVQEQKWVWKKRLGHLKERLKAQKIKIARSIKSTVIFKKIRGRRS
jgi:hypothetical protein